MIQDLSDTEFPTFVKAIVFEHSQKMSVSHWGGFAIYPENLIKGFLDLDSQEILNLIQTGIDLTTKFSNSRKYYLLEKLKNSFLRFYYNRKFKRVLTITSNKKPVIIYHHMNSFVLPPVWVISLSKKYNILMVTSIIDFQEQIFPMYFTQKMIKVRNQNYEVSLKMASSYVTASPFLADEATKIFDISRDFITIAPLGWNHIPYNLNDQPNAIYSHPKPYMVLPAKSWAHKGHLPLIESFAKFDPDFELLLSGSLGMNERILRDQISALGMEDRIHIAGFRSSIEHFNLIKESCGMVLPSVYEGFGLPYVEASQLSVPIFTFNNESALNLLGYDAAYIAEKGDFDSLVSLMIKSRQDVKLREHKIELAFKKTHHLIWEETSRKTLGAYLNAVKHFAFEESEHFGFKKRHD